MITRIVKLSFKDTEVANFLSFFDQTKEAVVQFPGCRGMKLLNDQNSPCIFFTYSQWESEEALENYRNSDLFQIIWPRLKIGFNQRAEAWTCKVNFESYISDFQ
jgi:quinol monooxygenase YgiN